MPDDPTGGEIPPEPGGNLPQEGPEGAEPVDTGNIEPTGRFRIYLGAAAGVGKTVAMLDEGWRRHNRGTDVVIGFVETHNRPFTSDMIRDLEVVPRKVVEYRGGRSRRWTPTPSSPGRPTSPSSTSSPTRTCQDRDHTRNVGRTSSRSSTPGSP